MADELPSSFDDLVGYRQQLYKFCFSHRDALDAFQDGISFKLHPRGAKLGSKARHLSSSATCIESLLDCPPIFHAKKDVDVSKLAEQFALSAITRPHDKWKSDESARVYCRCRTLPLIVCYLPKYQNRIEQHLRKILWQLTRDVSRLAVGEAFPDAPDPRSWYPPNAFHTYWTLYLIHVIEEKFPDEFKKLKAKLKPTRFNVERLRNEMLLWAQRTAGYQIALHD